MFGRKTKRIKELEAELIKLRNKYESLNEEKKSLSDNWQLKEELHGSDIFLTMHTRNDLVKTIIDLRLRLNDLSKENAEKQSEIDTLNRKNEEIGRNMCILVQEDSDKGDLKKTIGNLKAEIESLKSKLTRKKPIKKSAQ